MMGSAPPRSSSVPNGPQKLICYVCDKSFAKPFNVRRHLKKVHRAGVWGDASEVQSEDSDTEADESLNIPILSGLRHTSAPPTIAASPQDSDELKMGLSSLPPLPQALSTVNTNIGTATPFGISDGPTIGDVWLITGSLAPRSHPGWSWDSPSNSITSAPRMTSPLPESISETVDPSLLELHQTQSPQIFEFNQGTVSQPENVGQTMNPFTDYFGGTVSNPVRQDSSGQIMEPIPQHPGQTMAHLIHQRSRIESPLPQDCSPMLTPVQRDLRQTMSPFPYDLSRPATTISQGHHSITSPMPQALFQTTSPRLAYFSATQAPSPSGLGTTQHLMPHGGTQAASASLGSLAAAQITPNGPEDITVHDPGVVFDSEMTSDTPSRSVLSTVIATAGRKRKLSQDTTSRSLSALNSDALVSDPVKKLKRVPNQQRGIDWLKEAARTEFMDFHRSLLAQWGVGPGYTGTCVLVPEAYRDLKPLDIMAKVLRDGDSLATPGTPHVKFSMYDYETTVVRALAWYSEWPRYGCDLDNLTGSGEFAYEIASHTCHHDHCLVHTTYEPGGVILSRQRCCTDAHRLRQQNAADVPEHCSRHQPPCLMQVSDQALRLIRG